MTTRTFSDLNPNIETGFLYWKDAQRVHQIELGDFLHIGREIHNQVSLKDEYASGRHARIEKREGHFILRDLRSRNGTYVNGARIVEALLRDGDRIRIGAQEFCFSLERIETEGAVLTSKNPGWSNQLARVPMIADSEFPVLISGPSGSGKDVLAQHIHRLSRRTSGPFIGVNCCALSESLVESELFGHVRGSFTGATENRKGAFEAARGGTLFLDEVGDLPESLQPKLLRALENSQIRPVGSDKSVTTDVRIVAATHRDLRSMVHQGTFREDLYFRLHVVQLHSPALRQRLEDFEDFLYFFCRQLRVRFSYPAIMRLKAHDWPGNIRELRNVIARAKAFYGDQEVQEENVDFLLDKCLRAKSEGLPVKSSASVPILKEIEQEMIKNRLRANHGNQRRTAADLNMAKSTLSDRIRKYGIKVEELLRD